MSESDTTVTCDDRILRLLSEGPATVAEVAAAVGLFRSTTFSALIELEQAARVERHGRRWALATPEAAP